MRSFRRWCVDWRVLLAACAIAHSTVAEEPPRISPTDTQHVFVSGVDDGFEKVRAAVDEAQRASGRDYRVVVVGDTPAGRTARNLLEALVDRWRDEGADSPAGYDPAGDFTIVLDVKGHSIAMRAPWALELSSGLDPETIQAELIEKVFLPRAKDGLYDDGLAALVEATERWVKDRKDRELARVEAARVFRTRTLPLSLLGLGALGAVGTLIYQISRHDGRVALARKKLAEFKQEVVALSDLLDAQQERHRLLPHTDPDFKTPMQGQTRSAYDAVQGAIRRYRERWLGLMDVWERAQERVDAEWFLGTAAADECIRLLDSAEARPPLDAVAGECRGPLDVLEQAHEKSRALADELDAGLAAADARIVKLAERGRSGAAFQAATATVARGLALARHDLESDPIQARGRLEGGRAELATLVGRLEGFEAADDRRLKAAAAADEAEARIRAKRAEGWLLAEPGADPMAHVVKSREHVTIAAQLLDAGEVEGAIKHLEHAERHAAEAAAILENVVAAKGRIDDLLPGAVARLDALATRRAGTVRALEHLSGSYAESSWTDLADNVAKADEGLERIRRMIAEAQSAAEPARQHYFKALALLEEAVRQEAWVEGCQTAVTDRRQELDGLLASLPKRAATTARRIDALAARLDQQRTDRVRANEQCREAGRLVQAANRGLAVERPDLPQAGRVIDAAETAASRAEELATEDERLARQAFAEIEETDSLIRRAAAWYAEGVSADVREAVAALERSKSLLTGQRYEDSIKASSESATLARESYAAATAEAERRRQRRIQEIQRRQMQDSFERMSRGSGPWVISLPGGTVTGPDPWRTMLGGGASAGGGGRSAGGSWSRGVAEVKW
ncbi:MAG: TPM domain-containing protein [Planctomycetia bacterium]|nr:TPM domain-containing protein [Planctomycetia bacterium]